MADRKGMGFFSSHRSMNGNKCYRDVVSERLHTLRGYLKQPIHFGVLSKISSTPEKVLTCHISPLLELERHTGVWRCLLLSQPTHPPTLIWVQRSTPCFKDLFFLIHQPESRAILGEYVSQHLEDGPRCKSELPARWLSPPWPSSGCSPVGADVLLVCWQKLQLWFGDTRDRFLCNSGADGKMALTQLNFSPSPTVLKLRTSTPSQPRVSEREQWNHWCVISIADIYTTKDPGRSETRVCHKFADWRWLCFCWCWYFSVIICPHHVVHRDRFDLIFWLRSEGQTSMSPAAWNNWLSKWKTLVLH